MAAEKSAEEAQELTEAPKAPKTRQARKPRQRTIKAAGHVIKADPLPETPKHVARCSACGKPAEQCPHGGDTAGWKTEG